MSWLLGSRKNQVLGTSRWAVHGSLKAFVAIRALQMALMDVHIPPHLAHGFLSLLWVDSVVAPPLPFWP